MRELISELLDPVMFLYVLLLVSVLCHFFKKFSGRNIGITVTVIWFFIITTPYIPEFLLWSLEKKSTQLQASEIKNLKGEYDIIVLGSGHVYNKNLSANDQLSTDALSRLVEAIRIFRLKPGSRLILSGYKGQTEISHAAVLYSAALDLGIDSSSIFLQTVPSNTLEEAMEYKKLFGRKNLIVVTSAYHMPRAIKLFRANGLQPIASSASFLVNKQKRNHLTWLIPSSENVRFMDLAVHEYIGILWFRLTQ